MEIVINTCYGGYSLSKTAYEELGIEWDNYGLAFEGDRTNPELIAAIKRLGSEVASGCFAELKIIEIPDDVEWDIEQYDGLEWVAEAHRIWR